jgi:hypothetical protein
LTHLQRRTILWATRRGRSASIWGSREADHATPDDDDVSDSLRGQAELLRLKRFAEPDLDRPVAELQAQADERVHRLWSALVPLLTDLLVWTYRPDGRAEPRATRINDRRSALQQL